MYLIFHSLLKVFNQPVVWNSPWCSKLWYLIFSIEVKLSFLIYFFYITFLLFLWIGEEGKDWQTNCCSSAACFTIWKGIQLVPDTMYSSTAYKYLFYIRWCLVQLILASCLKLHWLSSVRYIRYLSCLFGLNSKGI